MGKIYVCESGCRFEGGSVFAASTSLKRAWQLMRERRLAAEANRRYDGRRNVVRLRSRMYWVDDFDYYRIREFDDG